MTYPLSLIVGRSGNGIIDSLASFVIHKSKRSSCVGDCGVLRNLNLLAVDRGRRRIELPEAVGSVNWSIIDRAAIGVDGVMVYHAKCVERCLFVFLIGQVGGEELRVLVDVGLCDHVFDNSLELSWRRGVELRLRKTLDWEVFKYSFQIIEVLTKARPRRPSGAPVWNVEDICFANSTP